MRITCPTCETSYTLADGALGAMGRKVRCARCGLTWHARPAPPPAQDETAAEAEWAAVEEEQAPAPAPGPSDDDWRAALADPDPQPKITGGRLPIDRDPADPDPPADAAPSQAADHSDAIGPAEAGPEDRGEPAAVGGIVLVEVAGEAAGPAPPVIEAEAPGFRARRARAREAARKVVRAGPRRRVGARILSIAVTAVAAAALVGLVAGSLFAREALVKRFPEFAGLYGLLGIEVNLRGLAFEDLRTYREVDGATPVLVVDGTVHNVTAEEREVPRLRFSLLSTAGREVYAWTMDPAARRLAPGETMRFRSRLPTPPEAATDVQVRFTDRHGP